MEGSYLGIGSTDFLENLRGAPLASSLWTAKEIRKFRRAVHFDRPEMHPYEPSDCASAMIRAMQQDMSLKDSDSMQLQASILIILSSIGFDGRGSLLFFFCLLARGIFLQKDARRVFEDREENHEGANAR